MNLFIQYFIHTYIRELIQLNIIDGTYLLLPIHLFIYSSIYIILLEIFFTSLDVPIFNGIAGAARHIKLNFMKIL